MMMVYLYARGGCMKSLMVEWKRYKRELDAIQKECETLPAGRLAKKGGFYYHVTDGKEMGITRNPALIQSLCRKKYLLAREKQLDDNMSTISQGIDKWNDATPEEMIRSFSHVYQSVPGEYFFHPSIQRFLEKPSVKNPYQLEEGVLFSKNGVPVRSKSEMLIANQLEDYNIPYRYEDAITLGKQTKYPDFTIKNPFNGKIVFWEHFGVLHHPGYEQKMNDKMSLYLEYGYIPFETIIYTFEFDVRRARRLQDLIEQIILR